MIPAWIQSQYADKQLLVLGGDIFDFRWSRLESPAASLNASEVWLRCLLDDWSGRIVYLPGNHDSHPQFLDLLDQFQTEADNFSWNYDSVRFGNTICLHGDLFDAGSVERLSAYRSRFHDEQPKSALSHGLYDLAVEARIHRLIPWVRHRFGSVCESLVLQLAQTDEDELRSVIFGHTHHRIDGQRVGPFEFHNPGAALKHLLFEPVEFDAPIGSV